MRKRAEILIDAPEVFAGAMADHPRQARADGVQRDYRPAFVAALALVVVAWWRSRKEDKGAGERAPLYALPTYTAMLELRKLLVARGEARSTWS